MLFEGLITAIALTVFVLFFVFPFFVEPAPRPTPSSRAPVGRVLLITTATGLLIVPAALPGSGPASHDRALRLSREALDARGISAADPGRAPTGGEPRATGEAVTIDEVKRTLEERGLAVEVVTAEVYERALAAGDGVSEDRSVSVTATTTPARDRSVGIAGALGAVRQPHGARAQPTAAAEPSVAPDRTTTPSPAGPDGHDRRPARARVIDAPLGD